MADIAYGAFPDTTWFNVSTDQSSGPPHDTDAALFGYYQPAAISSGTVGTDFGSLDAAAFDPGPWTLVNNHQIGTLENNTTLTIAQGSTVSANVFDMGANSNLVVDGTVTANETTVQTGSTATITVDPSGNVLADSGLPTGVTVAFSGGGGVFKLGDSGEDQSITVQGFVPGDTLDLVDFPGSSLTLGTPSGNTFGIDQGNTEVASLTFTGGVPAGLFLNPDGNGGSELLASITPPTPTPTAPEPTPTPSGLVPVPPDNGNTPTPLTSNQADIVD